MSEHNHDTTGSSYHNDIVSSNHETSWNPDETVIVSQGGPITDVIFDYCDVLLDWRPWRALEGLYPQGVIDMFFDPADEWGFDFIDRLLDSGVPAREVLAAYGRHHGPAVTWVMRMWLEHEERAIFGVLDGMDQLVGDLQEAGVRVWGLTNFTTEAVDIAHARFPVFSRLQDTIVSSQERLLKPDPALYLRAIDRFAVAPQSTVFFDDNPRNTRGARITGLRGVTFRSAAQARAVLGLS